MIGLDSRTPPASCAFACKLVCKLHRYLREHFCY